jgi:hypothetical protein
MDVKLSPLKVIDLNAKHAMTLITVKIVIKHQNINIYLQKLKIWYLKETKYVLKK